MAVYFPIAIWLRLPLCGFKSLKVHSSCSKHKSTGRKMQPAQKIIRGLWTSSHPQELLLHSLLCLLSFYSALNCTRNITLVGKRKRKKKICGFGSHLYIHHSQQVVLIRNIQRAGIILRHFSNVSLLGKIMHQKGEVCEEYFGILSPVCVWQPGPGPLPCSLSPILRGLWPSPLRQHSQRGG